jgi:uncharacterized protein YcgI (DUF1989 family)
MNQPASDLSTGTVVRDQVIPAREYLGLELEKGQILRVTDLEGQQVPHITFFNLRDISEVYSAANTRVLEGRWRLTTGHVLYSDECHEMATIVDDTVGNNWSGGGYCTAAINERRYGIRGSRNCRENLALAAAPLGIPEKQIPGAFAPFMNYILYEDGRGELKETTSRPGDHIDLRAEMDLFVAISNCPQDRNHCNGFNPTPLRIVVFEPDS